MFFTKQQVWNFLGLFLYFLVATFYQASEAIYELFDKVLVLEKGRCIYFGPAKDAKNYFLNMGFICEDRKSTPDFLTGICNPLERKVKKEMEGKVPETSFAFEEAWKKSEACGIAEKQLEKYSQELQESVTFFLEFSKKFQNQVKEFTEVHRSMRAGRKSSKYVVGIFSQLWALIIRQAQILRGNIQQLVSMVLSGVFIAIVFGTVYYQMELTGEGGFTRGGAIMSSLVYLTTVSGFCQLTMTDCAIRTAQ